MNKIKNTLLITLTLVTQLQTLAYSSEIESLSPIGRGIENKSSGEILDFVCLEEVQADKPCLHFQLRSTKDGKSELLGSEMIVKTLPREEFESAISSETKNYIDNKKPKETDIMPIAAKTMVEVFTHIGYIGTYLGGGVVLGFLGTVVTGGNSAVGFWVAGIFGSMAAIDPLIGLSIKGLNGFKLSSLNAKQRRMKKQFTLALEGAFNSSLVNEKPYSINSERFEILKSALITQTN